MGVLDPDTGKMSSRVYQDPFLRPGFKPDDARPQPIVEKPPPEDKPQPDNLPPNPRPEGVGSGGLVTIDQIVADTQEPESEQNQDDSKPSDFSLTDDQKYMLIGLAVIGAFFGFFK